MAAKRTTAKKAPAAKPAASGSHEPAAGSADVAATPKPAGALDKLTEAVRRLATGQNTTEEQRREILWLLEGKDPAEEARKLREGI